MPLQVYTRPTRPEEVRCLQRLTDAGDNDIRAFVMAKSPARKVLAHFGGEAILTPTNALRCVPDRRKAVPPGSVLPGRVVTVQIPKTHTKPARTEAVLVVAMPDDSWWVSPLYVPSAPAAAPAPSTPPSGTDSGAS